MVRVIFLSLWLMGCSSTPNAPYDQYAGKSYTYECKHHTGACYHMANERCSKGYTVVNSVETEKTGGVWGRYRAYSVTIRCN